MCCTEFLKIKNVLDAIQTNSNYRKEIGKIIQTLLKMLAKIHIPMREEAAEFIRDVPNGDRTKDIDEEHFYKEELAEGLT